ncbi:MAG: DUF2490 domain-containing protein [Chitinophagaceae bacterium]|nr:DUF2490 domain-containing protein [Chitinophagaceae bacterium]
MKTVKVSPVTMINMVNRNFQLKFFSLLLVCGLLPDFSMAQLDDTQLRQQIGVNWSPTKKIDLNASYRLDYKFDMRAFRRSNFSIAADYEITKWLSAGIGYRFATSPSTDFHRFKIFASAKKDLTKKLTLSFRSMVQHDVKYLNSEYLNSYKPTYVYRNKLGLKYALKKKIDLFAYSDLFAQTKNHTTGLYRLRSGLGAEYTYKKRNHLALSWFYQNEFRIKSPQNIQVFNIEFTFDLQKKTAKGKKDKSK